MYNKNHDASDSTIGGTNTTRNVTDACEATSPPVVAGGSLYGTKTNPAPVNLYQYRQVITQISPGTYDRINRWRYGVTNAPAFYYAYTTRTTYSYSRHYVGNLIRTNNEITNATILNVLTSLNSTTVSGKFRPKQTGITSILYGGVDIPVQYSIKGVTYDHVVFPAWGTGYDGWDFSNTTFNGVGGMTYNTNKASFAGYKENDLLNENFALTWFTTDYKTVTLATEYQGEIIDFGNLPQEVPEFFVTWLNANYDAVYENTYTVKDSTGTQTVAELTDAPPVSSVTLSYVGTQATLTLTGTNSQEYVLTWTVNVPAGKTFTGLGTSVGSNNIPIGTTSVTWAGKTLYEYIETYKPPATTFDMNLYHNAAEPNRVDKSSFLTSVGTLSGALRAPCSIKSPSIVIQQTSIPRFNYVYIPAFYRYYFVSNVTSINYKLWQIDLEVDPLMSYKAGVITLSAVIARQEFDYNADLVDTQLPLQKDVAVDIHEFATTPFDTTTATEIRSYVLTVIGA